MLLYLRRLTLFIVHFMLCISFADFTDDVACDLSAEEVLKEPFFSQKVLRLIGILSSFRLVFGHSISEIH